MTHVFAARRGGHGVCAFCPDTKDEGDHRELTQAEKDQAASMIDSLIGKLEK